jgi:eukaryotic translation initiation factor 2C
METLDRVQLLIKESRTCKPSLAITSTFTTTAHILSPFFPLRFDFDFYLQAHAGLQGTVKPTHYTVVYDENNLSADDIQRGTHDVSYLYARATKAVSLVPAAYYADLACERGRCYLNDYFVDDKCSTAGSSTNGERKEKEAKVFDAAKRAWGEGVSDF